MRAIELVKDRQTKEPDKAAANALAKYCYEHGVVVLGAGTHGNVLRFAPSLVISDEELDEGLTVIQNGLETISKRA
jgi:4-aminobutyrate aminotransferase / (S)-3-amino-2-methylpropionate transaminase / 5-aminovalerate transaminase